MIQALRKRWFIVMLQRHSINKLLHNPFPWYQMCPQIWNQKTSMSWSPCRKNFSYWYSKNKPRSKEKAKFKKSSLKMKAPIFKKLKFKINYNKPLWQLKKFPIKIKLKISHFNKKLKIQKETIYLTFQLLLPTRKLTWAILILIFQSRLLLSSI